jgi:alpha-mannosidase
MINRATDGEEVPGFRWANLAGRSSQGLAGATLVNAEKYGHSATTDTLRLTLVRSSYDPEPLPELGRHHIRYALSPHVGEFDPTAAMRAGCDFNHPCDVLSATAHAGVLPPVGTGLELLSPHLMLAGLKRAEEGEALVVRLFEFTGSEEEGRLRFPPALVSPGATVELADLLERPLSDQAVRWEEDELVVAIRPYDLVTLLIHTN